MRNRRLFPLTLLLCCGAALAEPVAEPTAAVHLGPARPSAGLDIRTQVDRARALPDDTLTYTVTCRNLGPATENGIVVEAKVPAGMELIPAAELGPASYEAGLRRLSWKLTTLAAEEQSAFSFRAKVSEAAPGAVIRATAQVQSATMPRPREAAPVATEVVTVPLLAALAVPDVMIARGPAAQALIDVESIPGQRVVERLEGLGVVKGYPDGTFKPSSTVTRAEATKMIVAVGQLAGLRDKASVVVALSRPATVRVALENSRGVTVRTLADGWSLPQGHHELVWDSLDEQGKPVPMGVYRYQVTARDADGLDQNLNGTIHVVSVRPLPAGLATSFRDVPRDAWFHPYVAKAEKDGVVRGYPGGQFEPNSPIRRVENAVMVVRAAGLSGEAEARMNEQLGFQDAADIPRWAIGYVAVAASSGATAEGKLLIGYADNRFLPQQNLTRAEAAGILERLLDREAKVDVTASGVVSRGHSVSINGQPVKPQASGRFRQEVPVRSELELVPIEAH